MSALRVPDGVLAFEEAGGGPAVLFLHGWSLDRRMWRPQVEALQDAYRTVALDRRGFGASTAPGDLAREPEDVARLLDALGVERCALVGMSQGGRMALRFAHRHSDRLWALVLQGAPLDGFAPGPRPQDAVPISAYRGMIEVGDLEGLRRAWRAHPLMRGLTPAACAAVDSMLADYDGRDLVAEAAAAPAPRLADALDRITVPTLVMASEFDTDWLQLVADALVYGLPNAERVQLAGAGHMANLSDPETYNARLRAFLDARTDQLSLGA